MDVLDNQAGPPQKRRMTSKAPELDNTAGASNPAVASAEPHSVAETALAADTRRVCPSIETGRQKPSDDNGNMTSNLNKRRDSSKSLEPPEQQVERLFSDRVVTVLVGPRKVKWCLHENLLSGISDFFKAAFNSGFKESLEDTINMPEDEPYAFELFVRWLYVRSLTPMAVSNSTLAANVLLSKKFTASAGSTACIQDYLRLYVLASKVLVEELENACVDVAHAFYNVGMRRPDIKDVQYVYQNSMPDCGMRRLLKERLTLGLFKGKQHNPVTPEWRDIMNETPDLGFDILSDIASYNWIAGGNAPARSPADECTFHRHERTHVCARL